jgi:hypothetical protein
MVRFFCCCHEYCTEEEFNLRFSAREGLWKDKGKNHTVTKDGYISRQEAGVEEWGVELDTLEALCDFVNKYNPIVIQSSYSANKKTGMPLEIEIYDDYRE